MQHVIKQNEICHGFDDTLGSIIQAHISNKLINDKSALNLCGYKRTHPLENRIMFTISLNGSTETEEKDKTAAVVDTFKTCCNQLIEIFNTIIEETPEE
jgi:DNA-directed RNA polymerase subunit L